jgi:hypothetical protein
MMSNFDTKLSMDRTHPVSTVTSGSKTNHFADGKAPIMEQAATAGDGPKFKTTLPMDRECSTGCK